MKVRLQAPPSLSNLAPLSLRQHFAHIYASGGIAAFYRGVLPSTLRAGILTSSQLSTYDFLKHSLLERYPNTFQEGLQLHLIASGFAGLACSAASAPIDTIKVRWMNDSAGEFRGALHCTSQLLLHEGPLALYKGFVMCFLRLWPHTVLSLIVFENLRKFAGLRPV